MFQNLKIKWKLTIVMTAVALIPLIIFALYSRNTLYKNTETNIRNNFNSMSSNILDNVEASLKAAVNDAKLQVKNELMLDIVSDDTDQRIANWIGTIAANNKDFELIIVTNDAGNIVASSNDNALKNQTLNLDIDGYKFTQIPFLENSAFVVKEPVISIFDENSYMGYYYIVIDNKKIEQSVYSMQHGELVQGDNFSISVYDSKHDAAIVPFKDSKFSLIYDMENTDSSVEIDGDDFVLFQGSSEKPLIKNIQCLIVESRSYAYRDFAALRLTIWLAILGALVFVIIASLFFGRWLSGYISKIAVMMEDIAQGDADLTKRLEVVSKDELGVLGIFFNQFMNKLQDIVQHIAQVVHDFFLEITQLDSAINDVTEASKVQIDEAMTVNTAMEEISKSIDTINSIMMTQTNDITDIVNILENMIQATESVKQDSITTVDKMDEGITAIEQLSRSISEIADNVNDASSRANETAEFALLGDKSMQETSKNIEKLRNSSVEASESMNSLKTKVENIKMILNVIQDIADQTNLLALNASIEAARAGEAGRGFAVVADSVRDLAEKTTNSVKEISKMVLSINSEFGRTFTIVEGNVESVGKVESLSMDTTEKLQDINSHANEMARLMEHISISTTEQSTGASLLLDMVQAIKQASQRVEEKNNELAQLSEHIRNDANKILDGSTSLAAAVNEQTERTHMVQQSMKGLLDSADKLKEIAVNQAETSKSVSNLIDDLLSNISSFKVQ